MGGTKRPLKKHIAEHRANNRKDYRQHCMLLHYRMAHNRDHTGLQFWGIYCVYAHESDLIRLGISHKEKPSGFFVLNTLAPRGLNIELELI